MLSVKFSTILAYLLNSGERDHTSNYRPIWIGSVMSKVLEIVINDEKIWIATTIPISQPAHIWHIFLRCKENSRYLLWIFTNHLAHFTFNLYVITSKKQDLFARILINPYAVYISQIRSCLEYCYHIYRWSFIFNSEPSWFHLGKYSSVH